MSFRQEQQKQIRVLNTIKDITGLKTTPTLTSLNKKTLKSHAWPLNASWFNKSLCCCNSAFTTTSWASMKVSKFTTNETQYTECIQAWHMAHTNLSSSLIPNCKYEVSLMSNNKLKYVPCHSPLKFLVFRKGAFSRFDICSSKKLFP